MKIREATKDDGKWLLHHRIGMFTDMGEPDDYIQGTIELTNKYLEGDWTKDYRYFLVEANGDVIGGLGISSFRVPPQVSQPKGVYAYLSNMFVEREHRGKGVGRKLLKHVIDVCKQERIGLLFLHASEHGKPLYESEGFKAKTHLMALRTSDS